MKKKKNKKWHRTVDNKMRDYGETDLDKHIIRINKKKSKKTPYQMKKGKGEVLNTIIHEELHRKHPKMTEKEVIKKTKLLQKMMGRRKKQKMYSLYS